MSMRQREWNKHEAVVLLEGFLDVLNNGYSRKNIVRRVSRDLREMAMAQGEEIDEIFRNENGISFQFQSMESAFKGYTVSKPATKLFSDVVDIYRQNRPEYDKLLGEARAMINNAQSCESDFVNWLSARVSPAQLSELYLCYTEIETVCMNANVLKKPLFETTDLNAVKAVQLYLEQNRMFRIKHMRQFAKFAAAGRQYYTYIKEMTDEGRFINAGLSEPVNEKNTELTSATEVPHLVPEGKSMTMPESGEINLEQKQEVIASESLEQMLQNALKIESQRNQYGTTLLFLMRQVKCSDEVRVKQILEQSEWAKLQYGRYYYVNSQQETILGDEKTENTKIEGTVQKQTESLVVRTSEDQRLITKYPIIYKRVLSALRTSFKEERSVTIGVIQELTQRIGRASDIEEILDNASWSKSDGDGYIFSDEVVSHDEENNKNTVEVQIMQNELTIDFNNLGSFAHTKPCSFTYFNESKVLCSSWTELYVSLFAVLYDDYPLLFKPGMSFTTYKGRIELAIRDEADFIIQPKNVPGTDLVIETNISATDIVRKVRYLLDLCAVDYDNVVITYRQRSNNGDEKNPKSQTSTFTKGISPNAINSKTFYRYLTEKLYMAEATSRSYTSAIKNCEDFARARQYEHTDLYTSDIEEAEKTAALLFADAEFIEYNSHQHNRFRAAIKKLFPFINGEISDLVILSKKGRGEDLASSSSMTSVRIELEPELKARIDKILKDHFEDGLILNPMRLDQFRMLYEEEYSEEASQDDDELTEQLRACGTFLDGRIYPGTNERQNELLDEIREDIIDTLRNGASGIYLSCVLQRWNQELADVLNIYNERALKELIMQENMPGVYATDILLKLTDQLVEPGKDILNYMKSCSMPVNYDQIREDIWYIPMDRIKYILVTTPGIVNVDVETYFYASNFPASCTELQQIRSAMEIELSSKGFLVARDTKRLVYETCPAVAIDTADYKDWAYRNIFSWIFRDDFEFSGAVVSEKGNELQMWQVYRNFCREHENLSLDELKMFSDEVGVPIYWDSVLHEMIRVDANTLIRKDKIHFNVEKTDATLETMISDDYVPINEITLFLQFPTIEVSWNQFVLECYLRYYSKKFHLLQVSVSQDRVCGIITHAASNFQEYDQAVIDLLARDDSWKNRDEALALIVDKGCQARKRWTGFDKIIQAAIQRRAELEKRKM